jgi:hypothetical protein
MENYPSSNSAGECSLFRLALALLTVSNDSRLILAHNPAFKLEWPFAAKRTLLFAALFVMVRQSLFNSRARIDPLGSYTWIVLFRSGLNFVNGRTSRYTQDVPLFVAVKQQDVPVSAEVCADGQPRRLLQRLAVIQQYTRLIIRISY